MELKKSNVRFVEETHQYFLGDIELHGITGMIEHQLFPGSLDGIPANVLQRAADYGTAVHNACEIYDNKGGMPAIREVDGYARITQGMAHECSEYLVSDDTYFASKIDKVYRVSDDEFDLGDIKTISKGTMNDCGREKLRWQLSIYAYMFEQQNPGAKVRNLFGIWLNYKSGNRIAEIIPVERIPDEQVVALMDADRAGQQYTSEVKALDTMPEQVLAMQQQIAQLMEQEKQAKAKLDELKKGLLELMEQTGALSWKGDLITISRTQAYEKQSFDKDTFLAFAPEMAELMAQCVKTSKVKSSVTIKINKK